MSKTVALGDDWLLDNPPTFDSMGDVQVYGNGTSGNTTGWPSITGYCTGCLCWPCQCRPTYYVNWASYMPAKIRLTLTEIQKLRAAAKKDAALKAVLQKFTPYIEVEVDF